jgi:hypothetical protein
MTNWMISRLRRTAVSLDPCLCCRVVSSALEKQIGSISRARISPSSRHDHIAARSFLKYALGWYPQIMATSIEALDSLMSVCCDPALGLQALERSSSHRSKSRPCVTIHAQGGETRKFYEPRTSRGHHERSA